MDILRERFGEAGFQDPPFWPRWEVRPETVAWPWTQPPQSGPTRFRLSSLKLKLGAGHAPDTPQVGGPDQGMFLSVPKRQPQAVWEGRSLMAPSRVPPRCPVPVVRAAAWQGIGTREQCSPPVVDTLQGPGWPLGSWAHGVAWGPPLLK